MKKTFSKLRNKKVLRGLLIVLAIIVIGVISFYIAKTVGRVFIENSLVQAPISTIAPSTGTLVSMNVYEGEKVKKGDILGVVGTQTVSADTDGLVIMANNQIGSMISGQNPLVETINLSDMRVAGTLDENKGLQNVRIGQTVSFTIDALPGRTFWGYVDEVSPSAKQTQLSFSISSERPTQQFVIYARFNANEYPEIKNGMSAKMTVYTNTN